VKQTCIYHPTQAAHWSCPQCSAKLCSECVVPHERSIFLPGERQYLCPRCTVPAEWCGNQQTIAPFWNRLPKIFAYPFSSFHSVGFIFVAAVFLSQFHIFPRILLFFIAFIYASDVLKSTAAGHPKPPGIKIRPLLYNIGFAYMQYLLLMVTAIFFVLSCMKSLFIPILISIFFFTPAIIIIMVTPRTHSISPMLYIRLIRRIGWSYLLIHLYLVLFFLAPFDAWYYIVDYLPAGLHSFFITFTLIYYIIISYHLMGYVAFQCHDVIGFQVEEDLFKEQAMKNSRTRPPDSVRRLMKVTDSLILEGRYDAAITAIERTVRTEQMTDMAVSKRYYLLLKMMNRTGQMLKHGVHHLDLVVQDKQNKEKQKDDALTIYSECLAEDPAFLPTATALFAFGEWIARQGNAKEAIHHFHRLVNAYPDHPLAPKAYFRQAQLLNDRMMNRDKAADIMETLLWSYPEDDIAPQARSYLAAWKSSGKAIEQQLN
jgi:tetratricopeptide (TPR) repeat protein